MKTRVDKGKPHLPFLWRALEQTVEERHRGWQRQIPHLAGADLAVRIRWLSAATARRPLHPTSGFRSGSRARNHMWSTEFLNGVTRERLACLVHMSGRVKLRFHGEDTM